MKQKRNEKNTFFQYNKRQHSCITQIPPVPCEIYDVMQVHKNSSLFLFFCYLPHFLPFFQKAIPHYNERKQKREKQKKTNCSRYSVGHENQKVIAMKTFFPRLFLIQNPHHQ